MPAHALCPLSPRGPFTASAALLVGKHQQLDSALPIKHAKSSESAQEAVLLTAKRKFPVFFEVELARARASM